MQPAKQLKGGLITKPSNALIRDNFYSGKSKK